MAGLLNRIQFLCSTFRLFLLLSSWSSFDFFLLGCRFGSIGGLRDSSADGLRVSVQAINVLKEISSSLACLLGSFHTEVLRVSLLVVQVGVEHSRVNVVFVVLLQRRKQVSRDDEHGLDLLPFDRVNFFRGGEQLVDTSEHILDRLWWVHKSFQLHKVCLAHRLQCFLSLFDCFGLLGSQSGLLSSSYFL